MTGNHSICLLCTAVEPGPDLVTLKLYRGSFMPGLVDALCTGPANGFWVEIEPTRYRWEPAWKFRPANAARMSYWHEVV